MTTATYAGLFVEGHVSIDPGDGYWDPGSSEVEIDKDSIELENLDDLQASGILEDFELGTETMVLASLRATGTLWPELVDFIYDRLEDDFREALIEAYRNPD